ncbi:copper-binding protein [Phenylobacterium sp. 58.2.17]|uniref:copper-binding protein n=1 Tax=Phenylobacterium sp. 58.2.17 TaxID=2969306 RepID=UPI0022644883|nr:copper-binding protein [Phenylobacterium sp. 58.2.17]MCX7587794.1 copper-binding protein [Phenylobacterium sp. 58.2.17]
MRALPYATAGALALALTLAACGQKPEATPPPTDAVPVAATPETPKADGMTPEEMAKMDMGAAATAKGAGVVTAIDKTAGTITLDHGPIAEAKWPAMTMAFKATPPSLLDTVKVGDKVAFDLKLVEGGGEITALQKQ